MEGSGFQNVHCATELRHAGAEHCRNKVDNIVLGRRFSSIRRRQTTKDLSGFADFLRIDKSLCERTSHRYSLKIRNMLKRIRRKPEEVTSEDIRRYLSSLRETKKPKTYNDILCAIKRFYRDYLGSDAANSFDFIPVSQKPIVLPSQRELKNFFKTLPSHGHFRRARH